MHAFVKDVFGSIFTLTNQLKKLYGEIVQENIKNSMYCSRNIPDSRYNIFITVLMFAKS